MKEMIGELIVLITQEIEQYGQLLVLARQERGLIVRGDLNHLAEVVRKKERLAGELAKLGEARARALTRVVQGHGDSTGATSLAQAAELVPGEAGERLQDLLVQFRQVVGRLVAANALNRELLAKSLNVVTGSLELFKTVLTPRTTYGAEGRLEAGPALAALNQTA
jgi:flagellar biosynthesis/type III secretory pathway chaperone